MSLKTSIGGAMPEVLRLEDLDGFSWDGTALAVLGFPIKHSVSPAMHNAALAQMAQRDGKFAAWRYFKLEVPPERLPEALAKLHQKRFQGLNLTIPHKVQAVGLVTGMAAGAREMDAVNTLLWTPEGYFGHNTDGFGMQRGVETQLGVRLSGADVILLGAGGAARAAAVQCVQAGCREVWIGNRTLDRLNGLLEVVRPLPGGDRVRGFDLANVPAALPREGILINATSVGLKAGDPAPMDLSRFERTLKVYDMIYNPTPTPLMRAAQERGMAAVDGLSMLVWQGARALEIWSGAEVPAQAMMDAAAATLSLPARKV